LKFDQVVTYFGFKENGSDFVILVLYVGYILLARSSVEL